jgi:DNA-binding CsgD family transcriptional regulator
MTEFLLALIFLRTGGPMTLVTVGLEPDVDTVTVSFGAEPRDILVVASGASRITRAGVQISRVSESGNPAAGVAGANRNSVSTLASLLPRPVRPERGEPGARPRARGPRMPDGLTGRELEIMTLVARGNTSRQIGEAQFISPRTVEMHVQGSMLKLGCRTRSEAVGRLAELGTLPPVA